MFFLNGIVLFYATAFSLPIESPSSELAKAVEFFSSNTDNLTEYRDQRVEEALQLGNFKGASMFLRMDVNDWANWFLGLWEVTSKMVVGQTAESIDAMTDEEIEKLIQESGLQEFYYQNDYFSKI